MQALLPFPPIRVRFPFPVWFTLDSQLREAVRQAALSYTSDPAGLIYSFPLNSWEQLHREIASARPTLAALLKEEFFHAL